MAKEIACSFQFTKCKCHVIVLFGKAPPFAENVDFGTVFLYQVKRQTDIFRIIPDDLFKIKRPWLQLSKLKQPGLFLVVAGKFGSTLPRFAAYG